MSKTSCFINGKDIAAKDRGEFMSKTENVHIGVFFDGTNNNAVQQTIFKSYEKQKMVSTLSAKAKKQYDRAIVLKNELANLQMQAMLNSVDSNVTNRVNQQGLLKINYEIKQREKELEEINLHPLFDTKFMASNKGKGYSNVGILYSLLQDNIDTEESMYHNIYVEGAGAYDVANGSTSNINGLGFGLGKTGVTALVSKAIKEITDWLQSKKNYFDENTKYHFYVFGFSRGSTCARLFTELTTRDTGKKIKREDEFAQDTSKVSHLMKNGRIPFMEELYLGGNPRINRENVTVDFLGIYDTVASIGFLKQKDGWTNALSWIYRAAWWNNYNGNFHYMNAHDYGLYSPHNNRVKHVCHICAGDEFRENFALVNLGKEIPQNSMEIIIPGGHSDIGGGYVDGVEMDVVLYKFIPRKFERFIKSNKITEILLSPYLRFCKERAKMFVNNPSRFNGQTEELSPNTLAKLGWLGKEWRKDAENVSSELSYDDEVCTKRVADWPNEIKFKRYVMRGYSNIHLQMMKLCVEKCGIKNFFKVKIYPYEIPVHLKRLGSNLLKVIEVPSGKRLWLLPGGSYSSEEYRNLRLNFLHFTSSCEIWHLKTRVEENKRTKKIIPKDAIEGSETSFVELNKANVGNNCNYDEHANICRIMYDGDEFLRGDHEVNIHYMYELSGHEYGLKEINC